MTARLCAELILRFVAVNLAAGALKELSNIVATQLLAEQWSRLVPGVGLLAPLLFLIPPLFIATLVWRNADVLAEVVLKGSPDGAYDSGKPGPTLLQTGTVLIGFWVLVQAAPLVAALVVEYGATAYLDHPGPDPGTAARLQATLGTLGQLLLAAWLALGAPEAGGLIQGLRTAGVARGQHDSFDGEQE
jgi:hypothetical protein